MKKLKIFLSLAIAFILLFSLAGCVDTGPSNPGGGFEDNPFEEEGNDWTMPSGAEENASGLVWYVNYVRRITGETAKISGAQPSDKPPAVGTTQWGVGGTDLGVPFYDASQKRLYVMFGDTFATRPMAGAWNSNAILYTDNLNFSNGISWTGALKGNATYKNGSNSDFHRQITPDWSNADSVANGSVTRGTSTQIPTGGIVIDGNYYMFYMEITKENFLPNGEWDVYKNRVMKSADKGQTWAQLDTVVFDGEAFPNFKQVFPLEADGYIYLYGLPGGRSGGLQCARVAKANFENMNEYEYLVQLNDDGTPKFIKGASGANVLKSQNFSSYIIPPACGEMSIIFNKYLNRYVATYQSGSSIVMRTSKTPYGEFSAPVTLTTSNTYSGLYGAFSHEMMTTHNGKRMYFLLSRWVPTYNVQLMEVVFH